MPKPIRKLAAIMFSDIVGYTALMGDSEQQAMQTINANREIHQRLILKYQGRIVKELVNNSKPAGNHSITFYASEYASGIYFYRLSTDNFTQVKSLVLLR